MDYCNLQLGVKGGPALQEHAGHCRECGGHNDAAVSTERVHQAVEDKSFARPSWGVEAEDALLLTVVEGSYHGVEEGPLVGVEEGESCLGLLHLLLAVEGRPLPCKERLVVGDGCHCHREREVEGGQVLGVDQQLLLQPSEKPESAV